MVRSYPDLIVILIGGSSHSGKTTLAKSLGSRLGGEHLSTDTLARHPGRPWKPEGETVPAHVAEHYLTLPVDELIEDVLRHYKYNVWPQVETIVKIHVADPFAGRIIIEGSALWPESVATLDFSLVAAIWLTAGDELFQQRIYAASDYQTLPPRNQQLVDKFLDRTLVYNARMMDVVNRLGLTSMNVEASFSVDDLTAKCISLLHIA